MPCHHLLSLVDLQWTYGGSVQDKLTKRVIEGLKGRERPYEVRDSVLTGLLLRVQPSGVKAWYFDYRHKGTRNRRLIGRYPGVSAEGARESLPRFCRKSRRWRRSAG